MKTAIDHSNLKHVMVTPLSRDGGRNVMAQKVVAGIPLVFMFECKRYAPNKKVRLETIRALLGAASTREANVNKAVLVTTSTFTRGGWDLIASEAILDGKDYKGYSGMDQLHPYMRALAKKGHAISRYATNRTALELLDRRD